MTEGATRLTEQAASFLFFETPQAPLQSLCVSRLQGSLDLASLAQRLAERLPRLPRYRQKLAFVPFNLGLPLWVDDPEFHLDRHLSERSLAPGTDFDSALADIAERCQRLLPRDRPLWFVELVHGVEGATLVVHGAHQALLDGASLDEHTNVLCDLQAEPKPVADEPSWSPEQAPRPLDLAQQALADAAVNFTDRTERLRALSRENSELVRRATESVGRFVAEPVYPAPWNRGFVSARRLVAHSVLPAARFRAVRKRLGGTVNDVVLAVVAEAAARYLQDLGEGQQQTHLRVMCPVMVRREDAAGARRNRLSGVFPVFDLAPGNAADRLRQVIWEMEGIKQNREAQALQLLTELAPPIPMLPGAEAGGLIAGAMPNFTTFNPLGLFDMKAPLSGVRLPMAGFNFACVNVPGARTGQFLAGLPVLEHVHLPALAGNLGYGVCVAAYDQSLVFTLLSDPQLMPDLDRMQRHVETVAEELTAAAA